MPLGSDKVYSLLSLVIKVLTTPVIQERSWPFVHFSFPLLIPYPFLGLSLL